MFLLALLGLFQGLIGKNPLPVKEESVVSGLSDIQGCVCGLHLGGVDAARFCAEEPVWQTGAGELQEPGLLGENPLPLQLDLILATFAL